MGTREYDPGTAELDVLKALWECGPGTVRHVLNHLHDRGRHVAYTTAQTLLTRLEQKNLVKSDKSGLAFVYRAAVTRERISTSRLHRLVEQLYDGAAGPLVLQLMRCEKFTQKEIAELQALIDELEQPGQAG